MNNKISSLKRQTGVVLVVSLIMLLLLTLIGLTGMQTTSMEEKMAGNTRNQNLSFQSAESALRAGEASLTLAALPAFNDTNGMYSESSTGAILGDLKDASNWDSSSAVEYDTATLVNISEAPQYLIQQMPTVDDGGTSLDATAYSVSEYYRVTAIGKGGNTSAVSVVQSIYKR